MTSSLRSIRNLTQPRSGEQGSTPGSVDAPTERCEMCSVALEERHGHVADLDGHRLLCCCRACSLLFTREGAGRGRFKALPTASRHAAEFAMTQAQWDGLQIPVNLVFLMRQSDDDRVRAFYPGPAGTTESLLDLAAWSDVVVANPVLDEVADDVEAVLLRRHEDTFECFVVPVDVCYELAGLVRVSWDGFSGGEVLWRRIDEFFAALRVHSTPSPSRRRGRPETTPAG